MMGKISVLELAAKLMDRKGLSKKNASAFVNMMFDVIQKGLEQDKAVKIKGFGTFKIISVDDRESINVNTGERVLIEGHSKITFTPDAVMKELVNKPFSQFETVVLKDGVDFDDMDKLKEEENSVPEEESQTEEVDAASAPLVDFTTGTEVYQNEPITLQGEPIGVKQEPILPKQELVVEQNQPIVEEEQPVMAGEQPFVEEKQSLVVEEKQPLIVAEEPRVERQVESPENVDATLEPESQPEESNPMESSDEEIEYEDETSSNVWKIIALAIICCLIGFVAGYFVGSMRQSASDVPQPAKQVEVTQPEPVVPDTIKQEAAPVEEEEKESEEIVEIEPRQEIKEKVAPEPKSEVKPEVKPELKQEPKPEPKQEIKSEAKKESAPVSPDKYEQMDTRILYGAYRIVGLDHVEKIKPTDNLARICKRTLGPGMECYLEAFNGIKGDAALKPGQDIKIPKLVLKKKKAKK